VVVVLRLWDVVSGELLGAAVWTSRRVSSRVDVGLLLLVKLRRQMLLVLLGLLPVIHCPGKK
jgi:hypothetical protein